MPRLFLAAAFAALTAAAAVAAPVPKAPPPPAPKASASLILGTARMNGDLIQVTESRVQTVYKQVQETQEVNGQTVVVTRSVPENRTVQSVYNMNTAATKATTADGKEIAADDLAKKLGDGAAVVRSYSVFDAEWKKLFADDVIFLEPKAGMVGGGGVVRPGVVLPAPPLPVAPPQLK